MYSQQKTESPLAPFRVLDLTDEKGFFCGKALGDLGADVIKIEQPGGDPSRNIGPFYHDIPDPEKSLYWFAFNANKRGITLNIGTRDGQEIFKRLVKTADFVIESFPPGHMDEIGLGYKVLSNINPRVIMTSITPFGQTGPLKDYQASDLIAMAMGGLLYLCGDPDRPPVRVSFPQAYLHAGEQAALGTMVAHYHREATGEGQCVDVSTQESVQLTTYNARLMWEFKQVNLKRAGRYRAGFGTVANQLMNYACKDGHVCFVLFAGASFLPTNRALMRWMDEEGMAPDSLKTFDWEAFDMAKTTQEELDRLAAPIAKFFLTHTKAELYEGALKRRIMLFPVSTVEDIEEDPQLAARDFWVKVQHPELGQAVTYPGAFARLSESPYQIRYRAPLIGEHNQEIYQNELGFSKEELIVLQQNGII